MSDVKVKFGAEDTGLSKTVDNIDKDLRRMEKQSVETSQKFSIGFKGMAAAAAGVAVGIGAIKLAFNVVQGTVAAFGEALDMGGRLSDLSARTGETAGKVLLLERAFTNAGSSAEKVGPTINKLQKFITDAADGAEANTLALGKLGISLSVLRDQSPTEQLRSVAQALSNIADPTERGALAMKVFGKNGGELLPFLRDFSGSLDEAKSELGSMVRIMDEKNAVFDTVSDKIQVVKGKLTEFAAGILAQTVPALELFTVALSRIDAAALGERLAKAFVGGQEAWLPYLYTAIRRLAIDLSRRDDRRKRREDNVGADAETGEFDAFNPWFESDSSDDETRAQLEKSLKELPAKFSEVILMKIWGDRTFAEIGEILEISQNTAASRYRYGLEALKKSLANARNRGDLSI